MVSTLTPPRKRSARDPFRTPLWDDQHPEFQRIDALLPADHHARWLASVVARLDLTACRLSYAGYGSLAYPVQPLLAFVLFMYSTGVLSPAEWFTAAKYDDQAKWLLRGLLPSRALLYRFGARVEPFLDDWHAQIIAWAIFEKITAAERGSLDGTLIAALASRHRLVGRRCVDRRLLLLQLLIWFDDNQLSCNLATFLDDFAAWLQHRADGRPVPDGSAKPPSADALDNLVDLLRPVLDGQVSLPAHVPAWVPATATGRKRVLKRYLQAQERLAQRLVPYQQKKKLSKKDKEAIKRLKTSLSDPEAALGWDKVGTYRPLYNLFLVQATDAPLTLAWDVLGCNNDQGQIQVMMEKTKKQVNHYLKELLIDGGFLNVSDVVWCEKEQIVIFSPPAKAEAVNAERAKAMAAKVEALKAMAAKVLATRPEAAKAETVKAEVVGAEAVQAEAARAEAPQAEAARMAKGEAVRAEATRVEAAKAEAAKAEAVGAEAVDAEAVGAEAVGAEAVDAEAVGAEAVGAEAVGAEAVGAEAVGAEAVGAEAVGAEAVDAEAVGAEAVDAEAVGAEAVGAEGARVEATKAEAAKAEAARVEATKAEAAKAEAATAEAVGAEAAKGEAAKGKEEKLPKSAFRFDNAEQAYYCPQGKRMEPVSRTTEKRSGGMELPVITYRAAGADCQACPQQARCTSNPKKGRVVKRYEGEEAMERLEQRMQEPAAQQIYKLRCQTVELGNADLKEHRGLRFFRVFGRKRTRAQAGLVILASNGLKIMNALQRRRTAEHPSASQEKRPA